MILSLLIGQLRNAYKSSILVTILLFHVPWLAAAQYETNYTLLNYSSSNSKKLISEIRSGYYDDLKNVTPSDKRLEMTYIYEGITRSIVRQVTKKMIVEDDLIQNYIDSIFNQVVRDNHLSYRPMRMLVSRNVQPNAACMGEGTFIITLGLLSKSSTESQIAFAIAHELAHYELRHVLKKIEREVTNRTSKKVKKGVVHIINNDRASSEDIEELKDLVYTETRYSRKMETQADSLAFVYLKNTDYNLGDAFTELNVLDSAFSPKYELGEKWFDVFNFNRFPFQNYWLKPRLSVYSQKPKSIFFFDADSLLSHPEIAARKAALLPYLNIIDGPSNIQSPKLSASISTLADFECVEAAYFQKLHDVSLFYSLQLLSVYPNNSYLASKIGLILLQLHDAKDYGTFNQFVPGYTAHYSPQLKMVNNFLYNLSQEELGELAYLFMNKVPHFNSNLEEHYFLLWKASGVTGRIEIKEKVEAAYRDKFDKRISSYPDPFEKERPQKNSFKIFPN